MRTIWIFDIDSTLADNDHRAALLHKQCNACLYSPVPAGHHAPCPNCGCTSASISQESFDKFLDIDLVSKDKPIEKAVKALNRIREMGGEVKFITGRGELRMGAVTRAWLRDHAGWQEASEELVMRAEDEEDLRASVYKERAVQRIKDQAGEPVLFIFFEDDPHIFNVYNKHGLCVKCPGAWDFICPEGSPHEELRRTR